jgi:hypothetical protein
VGGGIKENERKKEREKEKRKEGRKERKKEEKVPQASKKNVYMPQVLDGMFYRCLLRTFDLWCSLTVQFLCCLCLFV